MERFQSLVDLVKKRLSYVILNNLSSLILLLDWIAFHLIMPLTIIRTENKIPAFPAKAREKHRVF